MSQANYRTDDLYQRAGLVLVERCGSSERKLLLEALDDMVDGVVITVRLSSKTSKRWRWLHASTHARLRYQAQRVARKFRARVVLFDDEGVTLYETP
jgi:hypothetical protein